MERRIIFPQPWQVDYGPIENGPIQSDKVLVRTRVSGISHGTEMTAFTGSSPFVTRKFTDERYFQEKRSGDWVFYPFWYAGYDCVGVVEQVGPEARRFAVGDRVWFPTQHQTAFTFNDGDPLAMKLPPQVSDDDAAMLNLASIGLCAVYDAQIQVGDVVVVFGAGVVGQIVTQCAFLSGARRVILVEPLAERRALARSLAGAETIDPAARMPIQAILEMNENRWPDAVIETSGSVVGLSNAVKCAGLEGTVIAAGFYCGDAKALCLGEEFLHNRVTIKASMSKWGCAMRYSRKWNEQRLLTEALHLIATRRLSLSPLVSSRFTFDEGQKAYDLIAREPHKHLKVLFDYPMAATGRSGSIEASQSDVQMIDQA